MKSSILVLSALLILALDLNAEMIYVEPVRDAKFVNVNNNIIIGFDETIKTTDLNSVLTVTGSKSGIHTGDFIYSDNNRKLIFKPHQAFDYNETVEVRLNGLRTSSRGNNRLTYTFQTQEKKMEPFYYTYPEDENNFSNSFPGADSYGSIPPLDVTISNNPSPGNIFLNNFRNVDYNTAYLIIAGNDGIPVYSRAMTQNTPDFKRLPNGNYAYYDFVPRIYYAEDSQFNIVDSFYCGNGYTTDNHDLIVMNNGHAIVMSYDRQIIDMSQIVPGGQPNATVIGMIIQEIDENKNVVFQWRSWDHFEITDAIGINLTTSTVDYCHGNAMELDNDGNIMVSSRHFNEITKISRTTGEMVWRLGGNNNEFTFINDSSFFSYQHDIRRIKNGNITLYDNGNRRDSLYSRAVEYSLDEVNKTATLVWQYRNSPDIFGPNRGSVQRLKTGNTLICWGGTNPTLTEVTPSGEIALEMSFPFRTYSYRVFKDEVNLTLNVNLAIEGLLDPQTNTLNLKDTVTSYLRGGNPPFAIVDSSKTVVDSLLLKANFRFYNAPTGPYFISVKHRNALETWSSNGLELQSLTGVFSYDFTDSKSKAYGNNQVLKGSKYCFYSGDVDHNGIIDLSDINLIFNEAENFLTGYNDTDVNGDNITDLTDLIITHSNSVRFISVIHP